LERCVQELCALDGVVEKTAIALASTATLSRLIDGGGVGGKGSGGTSERRRRGGEGESSEEAGRRLVSLSELKACAVAAGGEDAVRTFLLESREMPAANLTWPAWRLTIVPQIMAQLLGISLEEEQEVPAAEGVDLGGLATKKENATGGGGGGNSAKRKRLVGPGNGEENVVPV
jgi:hypothetical protein